MIEHITPEGSFAVYLLHFEAVVEGYRHYVGITSFDRLGHRMIEHTTGRGAKLTSSACRAGVGWRLAHVWRTDHPPLERALIPLADLRPLCPVCRRITTGVGYRPTKTAARNTRAAAIQIGMFAPISFPNESEQPLTHSVENTP